MTQLVSKSQNFFIISISQKGAKGFLKGIQYFILQRPTGAKFKIQQMSPNAHTHLSVTKVCLAYNTVQLFQDTFARFMYCTEGDNLKLEKA